MAIALVGTNTAASDGNGGDVTVSLPGGVASGDLVLAHHAGESSGANEVMSTVTSGYTDIVDIFANDTRDSNLGVHWKIMGGTPDSDVVFTGFVNTDEAHVGAVRVYSGVDQTTPIDATTTTVTGTDGVNADPPSITTATNGAVVVAIVGAGHATVALDAPTGYTDEIDFQDVPAAAHTARIVSCEKLVATAGAEDPGIFGDSGTVSNGYTGATVALRPAAGGGGFDGAVNATLDALTVVATGSLALAGSVSKTLGALTSGAVGSLAIQATLAKTLGALTSSASGTIGGAVTGTVNATLGALTSGAVGSLAIVGTLAKTLGALLLSATGDNGAAPPAATNAEYIPTWGRRRGRR
jgi:hypothetical protein